MQIRSTPIRHLLGSRQQKFCRFFTKNYSAAPHIALRPIYLASTSTDKQLSMQGCIKILQSRLTKPVTTHPHTKLSPVPVTVIPVSSKPVSYKQLIKTVKQSRPDRISKPIVQVPQRPPASPTVTESPFKTHTPLFDPFKSLRPLHTPLQAHHIEWIQAPTYRYNKQLQTAI